MLLHAVSRFYEDGSPVTALRRSYAHRASSCSESQHAPPSALLAGLKSGQMDWRKQVQEGDKEQHSVPNLTVDPPPFIQTQEVALASSTEHMRC